MPVTGCKGVAVFTVIVKNSFIDDEGTVIEVGSGKTFANLTDALAAINTAVKKKTAGTAYTLVLTDKAYTEKKALAFPALKVIIKGEEGTVVNVPSITAKGDLAVENVSFKSTKGAAAVTAKKSLTAANSVFGKTTVKGSAEMISCTINGSMAVSGKTGETIFSGTNAVNGNLTVSNKLIVSGSFDVTGKLTTKGAVSFG